MDAVSASKCIRGNSAAKYYDEPALAALLVAIANINVWNRLNVATRQVARQWG